ncbi:unnamed protein product [Ectocarpus sp. CCAP 1310/34]|nr:unnamed protein product [Ectocarpus sp. CCAP 1310/34]
MPEAAGASGPLAVADYQAGHVFEVADGADSKTTWEAIEAQLQAHFGSTDYVVMRRNSMRSVTQGQQRQGSDEAPYLEQRGSGDYAQVL